MVWPRQDYASMVRFYGPVGERQTRLVLPYTMRLAWERGVTVSRITCHELVAPSLGRVLRAILAAYGEAKIRELGLDLFGGCLNVRRMRGGTSWSIHSWGAAIDLDPDRNMLRETSRTARFARPEYEPMLKAFADEGWLSLGVSRNYDWMHFQAAVL